MSKKPVPSQKQAPSSTRSRHSKYVYNQRTRLENQVQLSKCPNCGAMHRAHYACGECGYYRGKQVLNIKAESGTKATQIEA